MSDQACRIEMRGGMDMCATHGCGKWLCDEALIRKLRATVLRLAKEDHDRAHVGDFAVCPTARCSDLRALADAPPAPREEPR